MASSYHGNNSMEPAKNEQIITEFFAKSLHIILESRCPYASSRNYSGEQGFSSPSSSSSSTTSIRPRDKWFNLALKDCPAALENIEFWRQGNLEPMIADVVLVQGVGTCDPLSYSPKRGLKKSMSLKERHYWNSGLDDFGSGAKKEKIMERWIVQYESRKSDNPANSSGGFGTKRSSGSSSHNLYKKCILLLRSLYVTARLLPAYKLFRELSSSPQIRTYNLVHRVSSFVEPFTHREEAEMQRFVFTPIDTYCGRLCLSVLYRTSVSDLSSEPSTPMSPQLIQDYVGSPLADPLKMFPSAPGPHSLPSSSPFGRRHSWSYDLYRASPPSGIAFPSPTYSESHATSVGKQRSHGLPPSSLPRHLSDDSSQIHMKNTNYDEYSPSPNFSHSPSPSPPTYASGANMSKALLRCESAPVSIPASRLSGSPLVSNNQMLPPSPPLKHNRSGSAKTEGRSGLFQTSSTVDKLLSLGKEEAGKLSGAKISSNSSPQKSFSRSSSRLSFQDDYDDSEFSGPFVVDDDDLVAPGSRSGSFDQPAHPFGQKESAVLSGSKRSQDAAVALFCMMKNAPPLSRDLSNSTGFTDASRLECSHNCTSDPNMVSPQQGIQQSSSMSFSSSVLISPKTTADALEALRGFKELKDSILKQTGKSQAEPA